MKHLINLALIIVLLLVCAVPVFAQDATDEPTPAPTEEPIEPGEPTTPGLEVTPPDSAAEQLFNFILQLVYVSATAAGLVNTITGSLKYIIPQVDPGVINLALSVGLWVIYWVASYTGNVALFDSLVSGFDVILTGVLGTITTSIGAAAIYHVAHRYNLPIMGYKPAPARVANARG